MQEERRVRLRDVIAVGLWAWAALLAMSGIVALLEHHRSVALALMPFDMLAIGIAAVITMRCCLELNAQRIIDAIDLRRDMEKAGVRTLL